MGTREIYRQRERNSFLVMVTVILSRVRIILLRRTDRSMERFRRSRDLVLLVAVASMTGKRAGFGDFFLVDAEKVNFSELDTFGAFLISEKNCI